MRTAGTRGAWLVALALVSGSCHRGEPAGSGSSAATPAASPSAGDRERAPAHVRVVDAIPESRPLDVFAHDTVRFPALQYKVVTRYEPMPRGSTAFLLRPAGQDRAEPLARADEDLGGGQHYTLVAMPSRDAKPAALKVLKDDFSAPAAGKARVRVVNASPDAGSVAVFVGGRTDAVVSGVDATDASGFKDVDPIAGTLEVRRDKDKPVLARLPGTRLDPGAFYTVFLLGRLTGGLEAMLVEDEPGAER